MTYQNIKGPLKLFYYLSIPLNYSINYISTEVYSIVYGIKNNFVTYSTLKEDYFRQLKELNRFKLKEQAFTEAQLENIRLRKLFDIKSDEKQSIIIARIIAKSQYEWSDILILDKGIVDGVNKDMAVRSINGLVGKILLSDKYFSRLILITDKSFSAAVRLEESRLSAILSGSGSNDCILKYIPDEETVTVGDKVITSGLDMLFREGIPIGEVVSVKKSTTGLFQDIIVKPYENSHKLEEVMIIVNTGLPFTQDIFNK